MPAGLWTTPSDLCRFLTGVQRAVAGESGAILSVELARQMVTPVGDGPFGLGPALTIAEGHVIDFGHGGSNEGFICNMRAPLAGGMAAAVMTNSDSGGPLAAEVMCAIAKEYHWPGEQEATVVVVRPKASDLQPLLGAYKIESRGPVTISSRDGHVFAKAAQGQFEIFFQSPTKIVNPFVGLTGEFQIADDGAVKLEARFGDRDFKGVKSADTKPPADTQK